MKVVFFSNFLNHHQLPFCEAMYRLTKGEFVFVATEPIPQDRLNMGYEDMNSAYPFVLRTYDGSEARKKAMRLALESDVCLLGSAPEIYLIRRIMRNKLTFRYSERLFRGGSHKAYLPRGIVSRLRHPCFRFRPLYLLCNSAYTAYDYSLSLSYIGKAYKWGYFPKVEKRDVDALFAQRRGKGRITLLWAGRLLALKHPEACVHLAERLKRDGYDFEFNIIGSGPMEESLRNMIRETRLEDCVHMLGSMSPEAVRAHMDAADIYLFSSNFREGWGAVLNESMNSACAILASHAIGSVPYLLRDGVNGFIYENGNMEELYLKAKRLMDSREERERMGRAAYDSMTETWNADVAAERFLQLAENLSHGKNSERYVDGPCSPAAIIKNNWYKADH